MKQEWQSKPLENCIAAVQYTRKVQRKDFRSTGRFPIVSQEAAFTNGFWDDIADVFKVDTPVVIFGDHTQVLKYVDFDFVIGADGVKILRPLECLHPKFFFYQLQAFTVPTLGYARHYRLLKELQIRFPTLAEQHRIVLLLDQAFDDLATAKANAKRNLHNARALSESHLKFVLTQGGQGWLEWLETTLDKLATNLDYKRVPITKSKRKRGKYPYYGASGIVDYVAEYIFDGDALLVSEDGANLLARSTPIAFSVSGKYWVNNHAHILKFENRATQRFVEYYLQSLKLDEFVTGAAQPKLNQKALNSIPIRIPAQPEDQEGIVRCLEAIATETQRLENLYRQKLAALDALKKSLLQQAFSNAL